jgi:hypothetical protein
LGHLLFLTHYAQTMRVLGPIQTETSDSFTDSLLAFSVSYRRAWYGLGNGFRLITSRSLGFLRVSWVSLIVGAFANWASGAAMHRKITRQSRWNLRRVSDRAIPNQAPGSVGEGVETGWRASLVDEGTVRLSPKGESDRITQRSVVQIHPPQP